MDTFGEKWEVNIKFLAPLGEIPKEFQVAKKPDKEEKPVAADEDDDTEITESDEESASQPAAPGLNAKELALTKDATDVRVPGTG